MRRLLLLLATGALLGAACGDDDDRVGTEGERPPPASDDGDGDSQRYTAVATVLESRDHGPQLCLGAIATSLPPQCGGPDIVGWDWASVEGAESAAGTTWGEYRVVGTYDGTTFTLTEPPELATPEDATGGLFDSPDLTAPCAEPDGGWLVEDAGRTTHETQEAASAYAHAQPDFAGLWLDSSMNEADPHRPPARSDEVGDWEVALNDPTKMVLVVLFTGDLERHEAELRARWGGALCVWPAEHTEAELRAIQDELTGVEGMLHTYVDPVENRVRLGVVHDDGTLQDQMDAQHGEGVVQVDAALRPVG